MATPPPGYVDLETAADLIGMKKETIRTAAKKGELNGIQRVEKGPWCFLPRDLRRWRGIEEPTAS